MRKFFQFAIAAAAVCVMAACGNKSANNAESADSTATAQAPSNVAETDFFSVTGPDGWEIKADNGWDSSKSVRMEDVNSAETFKPAIKVEVYKEKKMQEQVDYYTKHGDKKGADLKVGSYTFTTLIGANKVTHCYTELPDGRLMELQLAYLEPEAEVVKQVVESIKIK